MDELQFHSNYDSFPDPLLLQTAGGQWLANPAADALCLSQTDLEQLSAWDGVSSIWLARQFFYVQGHRTADGLFLLLCTDAFLSSAAANLSSQLRQRLSQAFGGLSSLSDDLSGDVSKLKEDLAVVNRALFQIFRIVTELDDCAETELLAHKSYIDLSQWLRRLRDELAHWCSGNGSIALHMEASDTPLSAMADPRLLDCMVTHLVSNALKADPDGKTKLTLSLKKQGELAVLTICGSGLSFSPTSLTDPLWNQPTRLLPGRGLGLGLPIAQRIAALHGGALMITPTKDGSQAVFSLPLLSAPPAGYLASPAPRVELTGGFSPVRIILSDALPPSAFHPDFPDFT